MLDELSDKAGNQLIPRRHHGQPLPLSFSQERLWLLNQLEPDSADYHIVHAMRIDGPLQVRAFNQALEAVVARHAILRTTFALVDDEPRQIISQNWVLDFPMIDLRALPSAEKETAVQALLEERSLRPFDLAHDLMLRPALIQTEAESAILHLVIHHIASDGWSNAILFQEISSFYAAFSTGAGAPSLAALPVQYADYALWQRERLQGEPLERQLAFWRQHLEGAPAILELPTDYPRPTGPATAGGRQPVTLPRQLYDALKAFSRQNRATLFMTLLAAFNVLLYRYAKEPHIVVGTPVANRNHTEIEGLIGFFVNTLALHSDLSGNPTFQAFLGQVRRLALAAYAHQELPFARLVEELQPERHLNVNPLFQVMLIFQVASGRSLKLPGLAVTHLPKPVVIEQFDLTLSLKERDEGLKGSLTYNADLFSEATARRLVGHYDRLLQGIIAAPETPIAQLPLLTDAERRQILVNWNDTATPPQPHSCLHHLFEMQAERTPGAIAVSAGRKQLTYRELNERANRLAHYLRRRGVGPETLVGICTERSLEMVVGLMGILKAGAGYLPLDPAYPQGRLAFMAGDARVSCLLTQPGVRDSLPAIGAPLIDLEADWPTIARESAKNPTSGVTGSNVAYVMYTSGSTGKPKGVVILHQGVCNYLLWRQRTFPLRATDRVLQKTSFSFVDSVWELFEPLLAGAQMMMAEPDRQYDPAYLVRFIVENEITAADFIPTLLQPLLEEPGVSQCTSLRRVTTGSETVTVGLQNRFFARLNADLYNLYGPTEASVAATCWQCRPDDDGRVVPIGRPIANTQIYLLDEYLQPVPQGLAGEIHIGGTGLARGYLNRPGLTAEKFIANPFGADRKARLYKTGDLARYRPDGNLEFLGRADNQVKIRGYRVELGEIEAVIGQEPAVQEAVVIMRAERPGDQRLIAYLVAAPEQEIRVSRLRRRLQQQLPDYMVPAAFVTLAVLPLTPNGKVDRRALPAPAGARLELAESFVAPQGDIEEMLAAVWQEVLGLDEPIGVHDNFFALGGHSLKAFQVVSRLAQAYEIDLRLAQLFRQPTIAELASIIAEQLAAETPG